MASFPFSVSDFLSPSDSPSCNLGAFHQLNVDSILVSGHPSSYAPRSMLGLLRHGWTIVRGEPGTCAGQSKVRMHKDVLLLPTGVESSDPALARIGMRYLSTRQQFIKLAAALPLMHEDMVPDIIIVDDAGDLVTHYSSGIRREKAICSCMALLMDGIQVLSRRSKKNIKLVIGVPHSSECPIYVFWRYIPVALELLEDAGSQPGQKCMKLRAGPRFSLPFEQECLRAWYHTQGSTLCCLAVTTATPV